MKEKSFFLCIDKPAGMTSHDVVALMRYFLQCKRIGHTGTLDPFATGVLVLAVGHCTRLIQYIPQAPKIYQTRIQLGIETETADCDGTIISERFVPHYSRKDLEKIVQSFTGSIEQYPPKYSAIKVKGKRLYEYAREGLDVEIPSRIVDIQSIDLQGYSSDSIDCRIQCSKGTYIRSLGVDIARSMGTVAHLSQLRRLQSDGFTIAHSCSLEEFSELLCGSREWKKCLARGGEKFAPRCSTEELLHRLKPFLHPKEAIFSQMTVYQATSDEHARISVGLSLKKEIASVGERVAIFHQKELIAIAEQQSGLLKLLRVMPETAN